MTAHVSAVLVDDDESDRRYAVRLTEGGLECDTITPPVNVFELVSEVTKRYSEHRCDLVLLDYRLDSDSSSSGEETVNYRGAQAAAAIREHLPEIPLVLVTTEQNLRPVLSSSPGLRGLFDFTVLKRRLADRDERKLVVVELLDLALGFRKIRVENPDDWIGIGKLVGAPDDVVIDLSAGAVPLGFDGIASWLINGLLTITGPLVDEDDAAAVLGVSPQSFDTIREEESINIARYTGPFGKWHERWWRSELVRWLSCLAEDGAAGSRLELISAFFTRRNYCLESSACVWCGNPDVRQSCMRCRRAIDGAHGLVVVRDAPHWAQRPMACYSCIQAGRAEDVSFQPGTQSVLNALKSGQLLQAETRE